MEQLGKKWIDWIAQEEGEEQTRRNILPVKETNEKIFLRTEKVTLEDYGTLNWMRNHLYNLRHKLQG